MPVTTTRPAPAPAPAQRANRMTLDAIRRGKIAVPLTVLLYGVEGIGKSTFGACSDRPVFLGAEDGTSHLDVERFPTPESWLDVLDAIRTLTAGEHPYRTLVVDTLDWAEPILWRYICERDGKANIEDYGYGKGYTAALDEWRIFISTIERLRAAKRMDVVMLAHAQIKAFKNPEGEDFDRYQLKMHEKAAGLLKEWCEVVLFANHETFAAEDKRTKRIKGISTGARLIYTTRTAAYDAKNRFGLPEAMPLDWSEFHAAVRAQQPASPESLIAQIREGLAKLDEASAAKCGAALERAAGDALKLSQLLNLVNAKAAAVAGGD